ncbi:hypothetical protein B0I37DRAFT_46929 [Chaetomium sp. MPI-CAGE-AT-0009]|nr:hypothetical protein B0I37DRAFT_46929 [Chaetomium sp. MPI-CAGE-AT-0009]
MSFGGLPRVQTPDLRLFVSLFCSATPVVLYDHSSRHPPSCDMVHFLGNGSTVVALASLHTGDTNLASRGKATSDEMKGTKRGRLLLTSCYAAFTTNYIPRAHGFFFSLWHLSFSHICG